MTELNALVLDEVSGGKSGAWWLVVVDAVIDFGQGVVDGYNAATK